MNDVEKWLDKEGEIFIKGIGIKKGDTVVDFGCGTGHYTIPAAKVVGSEGKVYAIDKDRVALEKLIRTAKSEGLKNIEPIKTSGEIKLNLEDESIDVVLLYDILHSYYLGALKRKKLLKEVYRVSKTNALISVYPKHMEIKKIKGEIENVNFYFEKKHYKKLVHDDNFDEGYVLNFRKR
ncbi:MAG: class I SAM-dependent methyltransferase [Thermoplasmatales archaeon]|nr:class I SAM-dependent methyltransferase [Thermoplasmatales archaeon]